MKKKNILNLGIILIGIILIIFLIIFIMSKKTIVNIELQSDNVQKTIYKLEIKKNGDYKLITKTGLNEESEEISEITYNEKLTDLELEKINKIIKYVKEHANIKESKSFKYNYENDTNYEQELLGILENMIIAIENISMNDIKIGETNRRDFGNTMLDNIISTQL